MSENACLDVSGWRGLLLRWRSHVLVMALLLLPSVVADQRALSMSGHTLSPTGADREASCTLSRILWAYSKPGVGEHRELLGLQTGLGGDELS